MQDNVKSDFPRLGEDDTQSNTFDEALLKARAALEEPNQLYNPNDKKQHTTKPLN